ncbi:LysR family transcriptional regulator [Acinetobacter qingfengensis]|uniref:HTH lysR-type domain-containing protein n=1 Tax=Acinetobacter qingfengensis TaxID=1262585 RepID=A0A1E7RD27_9GAMM|nr:LysR family transcriptional regulator [Acinetobacter qingfengensis]KAA8735114.1 LysR family transcriptional regulator [Acinetobacter qingfengensis]OEY97075.1 hypothetical protein BJI46_11055 [Acinetobacter qingfengensis]
MLSLKLLQCFVTLVESKSFTKAAEKLNLTQPTISKNIQQLEHELKITLLFKSEQLRKRHIELTEIGERVYQQAKLLLQQQQNLIQDVRDFQALKTGTLKMGVPPLGGQLLTGALFAFHRQCPDVELSFLEVGSKGIEQALLHNELDAGVLLDPIDESVFYRIELCDYPLMVVLRADSNLAQRKNIALIELQNQSFLLFQENFSLNGRILTACQDQGFSPNIICRSSQWNLLADMVYQRMGVALLPKYYTDMLDQQRFAAVELIEPQIRWHLVMAWKKNRWLSPAVSAWLNVVRQHFSQIKRD